MRAQPLEGVLRPDPAALHEDSLGALDDRSPLERGLELVRSLVALRGELGADLRFVEGAAPDVLTYERGDHLVALNLSDQPRESPGGGRIVLATDPADRGGRLAPHTGRISLG